MFAVDGQQFSPTSCREFGDERPADHQRFFVRQSDGFTTFERRPRGTKPRRTNDGCNDDINRGIGGHANGRIRPAQTFGAGWKLAAVGLRETIGIGEDRILRAKLTALRGE